MTQAKKQYEVDVMTIQTAYEMRCISQVLNKDFTVMGFLYILWLTPKYQYEILISQA